ncbi:MAG: class I SAM-dependent methyltransferase [Bdellovibrionales bacterium]
MNMTLDFIVNKILFWLLIGMIGLEVWNLVFHRGVTNLPTSSAIRAKMIELLRADKDKRSLSPYTIVDVGSGNGALTRAIARAIPDAKIVGLEYSPLSVAWSNLIRKLKRLNNLSYRRMDFMRYDFAEPDAITTFLLPGVMYPLSKKFTDETKPGTVIVANTFPLHGDWKPEETFHVKTFPPPQGKVFLYRK